MPRRRNILAGLLVAVAALGASACGSAESSATRTEYAPPYSGNPDPDPYAYNVSPERAKRVMGNVADQFVGTSVALQDCGSDAYCVVDVAFRGWKDLEALQYKMTEAAEHPPVNATPCEREVLWSLSSLVQSNLDGLVSIYLLDPTSPSFFSDTWNNLPTAESSRVALEISECRG